MPLLLYFILRKWMGDRYNNHQSLGLPSVIFQVSTRITHITRKSPYQLVFGHNSKTNVHYWQSLHDATMSSDIAMNELIINKIDIMNSNIAVRRSQVIPPTNNTSKLTYI